MALSGNASQSDRGFLPADELTIREQVVLMTEELEFDYVIVGAGAARTISW